MLGLENVGGLDSLPGGGNFDENAGLVNALLLVQLYLCQRSMWWVFNGID